MPEIGAAAPSRELTYLQAVNQALRWGLETYPDAKLAKTRARPVVRNTPSSSRLRLSIAVAWRPAHPGVE